jgi:hypothetical protein
MPRGGADTADLLAVVLFVSGKPAKILIIAVNERQPPQMRLMTSPV